MQLLLTAATHHSALYVQNKHCRPQHKMELLRSLSRSDCPEGIVCQTFNSGKLIASKINQVTEILHHASASDLRSETIQVLVPQFFRRTCQPSGSFSSSPSLRSRSRLAPVAPDATGRCQHRKQAQPCKALLVPLYKAKNASFVTANSPQLLAGPSAIPWIEVRPNHLDSGCRSCL